MRPAEDENLKKVLGVDPHNTTDTRAYFRQHKCHEIMFQYNTAKIRLPCVYVCLWYVELLVLDSFSPRRCVTKQALQSEGDISYLIQKLKEGVPNRISFSRKVIGVEFS